MNLKSKILMLFLILAVLFTVATVSATDLNETSHAIIADSQEEVVLEANCGVNESEILQSGNEDAVLEVSDKNVSEPVLTQVVSNDVNSTVSVSSEKEVLAVSIGASAEPVLKSSHGKLKKVSITSKYNKYVTKKVGKYKIKVYKWKGYRLGGLRIYLTKNGKYVKSSKFVTRAYFKMNGKWRWASWSHASRGYVLYHHYPVSSDVKITKVQVKFRYY